MFPRHRENRTPHVPRRRRSGTRPEATGRPALRVANGHHRHEWRHLPHRLLRLGMGAAIHASARRPTRSAAASHALVIAYPQVSVSLAWPPRLAYTPRLAKAESVCGVARALRALLISAPNHSVCIVF